MTIHPEHSDYMPVAEFYKDSSIFITGGTGFLGKVLVEKLLWSCPGIKNIYLLMRPKRGQNVATRLAELIKSPILHRLRKARPEDLNKIVPIIGDVAEPELGISKSDQKLLIETVSVVFHAAAMIKFNETLKLAVTINLIGTKQLVKLCHHMLKLKALIYVSTAYCNCDKDEVKEVIYPPPYDPEKIMQCIEWMDDKLIKTITPVIIGNRPNTYTFTKALAESVLLTESKNLPVAIVRPSIVLSARCEPVPGWVDGWAGPAGLLGAGGLGLFRTAYCHGGKVADMIPVDMVINLLICAAWHRAREPSKDITVYNCCTGLQKPILWKNFVALCYGYLRKHPLNDAVWYPDLRCNSNRIFNMLCIFILHVLNAHILDLFFRLSGKKPKLVSMQLKIQRTSKDFEFFTTNQWHFKDDNMRSLFNILNAEDRHNFNFDVKDIEWPAVLESYILGIRSFNFNQHPSSLPQARRRMKKLFWMHHITQVLVVLLLIWLSFVLFSRTFSF